MPQAARPLMLRDLATKLQGSKVTWYVHRWPGTRASTAACQQETALLDQYLLYFRRAIKRGPIRDNFRQRRATHLHGRASLFLTRFQRLDVDARSRRVQKRRVLVDDHERTATLRTLASALHNGGGGGRCVRARARAQRRRKTKTQQKQQTTRQSVYGSDQLQPTTYTHTHTHAQSRQRRYTRAAGANTRIYSKRHRA